MNTARLIAAGLCLTGCSLINDFSIGDAGTDGGVVDAGARPTFDAGRDAGAETGVLPDSGVTNACTAASDRAAIARMDITVGSTADMRYSESAIECGRVECDVLLPAASTGDIEAIGALRICISSCLRPSTSTQPTSPSCESCFVDLAVYALIECVNPCAHEPGRCVPDGACACESCLCSRGYDSILDTCTGVAAGICDTL